MANRVNLKRSVMILLFLTVSIQLAACNSTTSPSKAPPELLKPITVDTDPNEIPKERLALIGKVVVYGTDNPSFNEGKVPIGKGQCPLCHIFLPGQRADRAPNLIGLEELSHKRVKEDRYKMFVDRLGNGEQNSGIKPHAQTGGEYILESEYCPNCYVPVGFGIRGTNDTESAMPIVSKPPISLTDFEIVAVAAFIQSKEKPEDYSKVTAPQDWEHYFGKKVSIKPEDAYFATYLRRPPDPVGPPPDIEVDLNTGSPEQIAQKMGCVACHKIPGLSNAKIGKIGPLLILKSSAAARLNSPEYQQAVKKGTAHATTPKEYVIESIANPSAFIVPGFPDVMTRDYSHKFTVAGLDQLVDFLLQQDEAAAVRDGLDRTPDEREGSLRKSSNQMVPSR